MYRAPHKERTTWYTVQLALMGVEAGFLFIFGFFRVLFATLPKSLLVWVMMLIPAVTGALLMSRKPKLRDMSFTRHAVLLYLYVMLFWVSMFALIFIVILFKNFLARIIPYFSEHIFRAEIQNVIMQISETAAKQPR